MSSNQFSWDDAQTFLAVLEKESFSNAAKRLGIGQPTVSRRIQSLEARLNSQIFERGRYGAIPTSEALRLQPAAEQMAKWAAEFQRIAEGVEDELTGTVKIAAPPGVASEQLAPFAEKLSSIEPGLQLEVLSAIEHVDLSRGHADIAIRSQPPNEPELVCLYEAISLPGVYASKAYAKKIKQPCHWKDLDWISWGGQHKQLAPRPLLEKAIPNFQPVFSSDDYVVQKAAAIAGMGALITNAPIGLEKSELVKIDIGLELPPVKFYLVCAKSMQHLKKIKIVAESLLSTLSDGLSE
ncbi:MAG: LysR family transcriptional regulator [Pseudohongiellaceae bacterium]